jgi:hypothetical protein
MLELSAAAHRVTANFIAELGVDPRELRELLAEDLESRVESVQDDVRLLEQGNVPPDRFIQGVELWSRYGADEELLELQR